MEIVADRFVVRDGRAVDLATGERVLLRMSVGGGAIEQSRWTARCQLLHELHHPHLAQLVDYGAVGTSHRFEAWAQASSCADDHDRAIADMQSLLQRCSLAAGTASRWLVERNVVENVVGNVEGNIEGRSVERRNTVCTVVPPDDAGYGDYVSPHLEPPARMDQLAIATIPRRADPALVELFAMLDGPRPHVVVLWGPPGSGKTTAIRTAVRAARIAGFVPVAAHLLNTLLPGVLAQRSLCVIDDQRDDGHGPLLLGVARGVPRSHVVLKTSAMEPRGGRGIALEPLGEAALVSAVRPAAAEAPLRAQIERAARLARGRPGVFASVLWRPIRATNQSAWRPPTPIGVARVAEEAAVYGAELEKGFEGGRVVRAWPAARDLATLVRQVDAARSLVMGGQPAPGLRQLRQTIGALGRRGHWREAADAGIVLASALLARGLVRDAQDALSAVHEHAMRAAAPAILVKAGVLTGHAWIDSARLDQAEAVLSATLMDADRVGDGTLAAEASVAMARCLFWKGDYRESGDHAGRHGEAGGCAVRVAALLRQAKAAVGLRDPAGALARVRDARALFETGASDHQAAMAAACATSAFVRLSVNDIAAAAADARAALAAAKGAHHPMRITQARLLLSECERRAGRVRAAALFAGRVLRISRGRIPPLIRRRAELLAGLCDRPAASRDQSTRLIEGTGLQGLRLYVPGSRDHERGASPSMAAVVDILKLCQRAEDEAVVIRDVCAAVRRQLHASAVAAFVRAGATWRHVAGDGARIDVDVAARALAAAVPIDPRPHDDRLEAAAPIVYGGTVIGGLVVRWPVATPYDLSGAGGVLAAAVAALAPVVSVIASDRLEPGELAAKTIIGQSAPIVALRAAIAASASAPFAVLVEGESGSGKELVARALHRLGPRRDRPFCTLNCAALPEELVEAELFGHARGAYTGAMAERPGVFEEAHGGTLFLDEVGELSARAQAKLLRVVQEGELRRLGENLSRRVDVRLVAATNRDLRRDAHESRFRQDLLYRLDVIRVVVPPLRERREDVPLLAEHFWRQASARVGSQAVLAAATYAALTAYEWPGNVRELQNVLSALAVRASKRGVVPPSALPSNVAIGQTTDAGRSLEQARRQFEERFVREALARAGGRRSRAAAELGVTRQGLTKLMLRLGIGDTA